MYICYCWRMKVMVRNVIAVSAGLIRDFNKFRSRIIRYLTMRPYGNYITKARSYEKILYITDLY